MSIKKKKKKKKKKLKLIETIWYSFLLSL